MREEKWFCRMQAAKVAATLLCGCQAVPPIMAIVRKQHGCCQEVAGMRPIREVAIPTRSQPITLDSHPNVFTTERVLPLRDMLRCHGEDCEVKARWVCSQLTINE
jgi:hypothetical protein